MAKKSMKLALLTGAMSLGLSSAILAADGPELMSGASARMLSETCAGCHGTDGASVGPASPSIGGMNGEYFVEVMQGFKSDEIFGTIMNRIAKGYTDEEIALMGTFFAARPFVLAEQEFDESLVKKGARIGRASCRERV